MSWKRIKTPIIVVSLPELGTTVERLGRLVLSQDASDDSIACCSQECGNGNSVASKCGLNT
jgi:hypothetical protein